MNKRVWIYTAVACVLMLAFGALSAALLFFDVQAAGESQAPVGFSTVNEAVFESLGQDEICLKLSDLCGALLIAAVGAFGVTGLVQVIRRRGILRADKELYVMAGGFLLLAAAYLFFEVVIINYRPVLDNGELAASYPSSHTMLAASVAGMGAAYLYRHIKPKIWHGSLGSFLIGLACVTVTLRLFSGVHWLTDIVGGVLLGAVIVFIYLAVCALLAQKGEGA